MTGRPPTSDQSRTDYLNHFRARVIQDALNEATETYWLRRADQFAAVGNARCDEIAQACRNRAAFARMYGEELAADGEL